MSFGFGNTGSSPAGGFSFGANNRTTTTGFTLGTPSTPASGNPFGSTPSSQPGTGMFGQSFATPVASVAPTMQSTGLAFGAQSTPGATFGAASATTPGTGLSFGATPTATTVFGSPAATGGTTGLAFGSPATTGGTTGLAFGSPATTVGTTGLAFGSPATTVATTGLAFASPAATGGTTGLAFASPAATGGTTGLAFGSPATTGGTTGLAFGSSATTGGTTGLAFGSPATTGGTAGLTFGSPATTGGTAGLAFGTPTATTATPAGQTGGLNFGSPATGAQTSGISFNAPSTGAGFAFGNTTTTTSTAASTAIKFSLPTTSAPPSFGTPATTQSGLMFGTPATTVQTGLFGTPTTSAVTAGFQGIGTATSKPLTFSTPATGFSLTAPATSQAPAFGLSNTGGGLFGQGLSKPLLGAAPAGPTLGLGLGLATTTCAATTTSNSKGLGGVDTTQSKPGLTGTSPGRTDTNAVKENLVPNEIVQTIETFKSFVKTEKSHSSDIARGSAKPLLKVQEDTDALRQMLDGVTCGLQKNKMLAEKLKIDTAKCLRNVELAQRTHETPAGLQYDNLAPLEFFLELVTGFEKDMTIYRQELENTEKHIASLSNSSLLTPQELVLALRRLHEIFVALAGRLHTVHNSVQIAKGQYLNLRKYFLKDDTNVFEETEKPCSGSGEAPSLSEDRQAPGPGPSPFSVLGNQHGFGMLPSSSKETNASFTSGNPLGIWSAGQTVQPHQQPLPAYVLSAGTSSVNMFSSLGFSSNLGSTLTSPQPVENQSFQLQKPPPGNKRSKR